MTLLAAPLGVIDRAHGACDQTAPVNNATVTCSGPTTDANPPNGWGTGVETGDTIIVEAGASVTGSLNGISVANGTLNNLGTISGLLNGTERVNNVMNSGGINSIAHGIFNVGDTTISNTAAGNISGRVFGIDIIGDALVTIDNAGTIDTTVSPNDKAIAIRVLETVTVSNTGDGVTTGIIRSNGSNGIAIQGATVNVADNTGLIQANGTGGVAIKADVPGGTADVTTSGAIQASSIAIVTDGLLTLNNTGSITSGGQFAVVSNNGDVNVNQGVTGDTGKISAMAAGATAIEAANGTVTVSNSGDGVTTGIITAERRAIFANAVTVTNSGTISAMAAGGTAIISQSTAKVDNRTRGSISGGFGIFAQTVDIAANAGIIEATGGAVASTAIAATNTVTVNNTSTGTIRSNGAQSIGAQTVNVTANAGTIEATGADSRGISATNVIVNNVSGGTISGVARGIQAATLDVTNALGATISGGSVGIEGSGIVRNAGTIAGGTRSVNFNGPGTNTLILQTGSVLNGDAVGSALAGATNKLILQGSGTADNHFTGFNTLDVEASGAWVWNSNSAIDATTVKSGTLVVDNVLASPITVNSGGTLAGQGNISGGVLVASGGVVAPGAAVPFSTLNASGNVSFQPGSVFRVNANAAGQNDKLAVTGSATLTGGTVNVLAGGSFAPSSSTAYKILTTTDFNGLGGTTFASVTTNLAFLTPSLSYTANDVSLTLETAAGGTGDPGPGDPGGGGTGGGGTAAAASALPRSRRHGIRRRLRRRLTGARSPIRSSLQCLTRPSPAPGRRSTRSPAKSSAACTTRKARKRSSRAAQCSAACGRVRMPAFPVILARSASAVLHWPTRRTMPAPLTQPRPRPAHEAPRAISPSGRRVSAAGAMPTVTATPPRCAAGSAVSSPASMRALARLAGRLCRGLYALRSQCRCTREQRRDRQRPARRLRGGPVRCIQRARRRLLVARQHRYQPRHRLPRLYR